MAEEAATEEVVEEAAEVVEETTETVEAPVEASDFNAFDAFSKLRGSLADEKLAKHAAKFTTFDDFVQRSLETRNGVSKMIKPINADSKPSEIAEYRKALNVPDAPEDYELPTPEGLDEEIFKSEAVQNELKDYAEIAHQHNIPKEAFSALLSSVFEKASLLEQARDTEDTKYAQESERALKEHWGAQYKTELELANRGQEFAFPDTLEEIRSLQTKDGRLLSDNPVFIEAMNRVGRAMSEDSISSFPVDAVAEQGLRQQLEKLTIDQSEAQMKGEYQRAQAIDLEIMEVARKISGDNPIVGAGG